MNPEDLELFKRFELPLPSRDPHGTEEDIRSNLKPLEVKSWRLEGNRLIAETDHGTLVNILPTNVIMTGVDDKNLPILKTIA